MQNEDTALIGANIDDQIANDTEPPELPTTKWKTWVIVVVNLHAYSIFAVIFYLACKITGENSETNYWIGNLLICLLGVVAGWVVGIYASPYDRGEYSRFITLAQAASVFLSGYFVSKLDKFLDAVLYDGVKINEFAWKRAALFILCFLLYGIITYINRTYFPVERAE